MVSGPKYAKPNSPVTEPLAGGLPILRASCIGSLFRNGQTSARPLLGTGIAPPVAETVAHPPLPHKVVRKTLTFYPLPAKLAHPRMGQFLPKSSAAVRLVSWCLAVGP
jgi:hypothetical protein